MSAGVDVCRRCKVRRVPLQPWRGTPEAAAAAAAASAGAGAAVCDEDGSVDAVSGSSSGGGGDGTSLAAQASTLLTQARIDVLPTVW